jgi:hypothetical protein
MPFQWPHISDMKESRVIHVGTLRHFDRPWPGLFFAAVIGNAAKALQKTLKTPPS